MKELSIEEKAKAYDEALEKAHKLCDKLCVYPTTKPFVSDLQDLFPELKESDDEKIRKVLLNDFKNNCSEYYCEGVTRDMIIAWLEKQGQVKDSAISQHENKTCKENDESLTSEDERIRKWIIAYLENRVMNTSITDEKDNCLDAIRWLEKQCNHKPADKVEPKFRVGDWIVTNYGKVNQVVSVDKDGDGYTLDDGAYFNGSWRDTYHLWTIQDAKDGDILYNKDYFDSVFIYKGISDKTHACLYYTRLFKYKDFFIYNDVMLENGISVNGGEFYPATKEQRDLLFQKMHEAGYEWDAEKKELRKIEQKLFARYKVGDTIYYDSFGRLVSFVIANIVEDGTDNPTYEDKDGNSVCQNDIIEQKPAAWSEEDKKVINLLLELVYEQDKMSPRIPSNEKRKMMLSWLKSLKDRVQPKQEWGEEDERRINDIMWCIEAYKNNAFNKTHIDIANRAEDWLKSLRPQNWCAYNPYKEVVESIAAMVEKYAPFDSNLQDFYDNVKVKCKDAKEYDSLHPQNRWKPSNEQMEALLYEVNAWDEDSTNGQNLKSLYQDLKKLMEE